MDKNLKDIPLIPLRGMTVFPYMVVHFDVGREKSKLALEDAMINGQKIFLSSQKEYGVENPHKEDIYNIGTICNIKQILKLPNDVIRILVEGESRGILREYIGEEPFFKVAVEPIEDKFEINSDFKALVRLVVKKFNKYINLSENGISESIIGMDDLDNPGRVADIISAYLVLEEDKKT
jgi:ATP-dependent Lon protease